MYLLVGANICAEENLNPLWNIIGTVIRSIIARPVFLKNIIHNILIFLPLGFFSSYYLNNKKASMTFMISLIISTLIEGMLYYLGRGFNIDIVILNIIGGFIGYLIYIGLMAIKGRLPKFMKSDTFINIILILLIILIVLFSLDINILNYL